MNDKNVKLYIANEQDRLTVVTILAKNGYTVSIGKEKQGNGNKYVYFVEGVRKC